MRNPRPLPRDFRGVYRAEPEGRKLTLLADDFVQPNGLCFSRDEAQITLRRVADKPGVAAAVFMPLAETFYATRFGQVRDRLEK